MKTKSLYTFLLFKMLVTGVFTVTSFTSFAVSDWQPVVSDKLVKLPANVIYQRIENDFSASPLASKLNEVEQLLTQEAQQIKALQQLQSQAIEQEKLALQIDIVDKKSSYVSLLKQSHELRSQALNQRQALYEKVLNKLNAKKAESTRGENYQIQQHKLAAKQRFKNSEQQVQLLLNQYNQVDSEAKYQTHYQNNIDKIAQLKRTFNAHAMNAKPELNGFTVSDQEYVRELLIRLSTERSILSQENTMLSYMTRLVALDAENLTLQLNESLHKQSQSKQGETNHYQLASQATDLFVEGEHHE